VTSVARTVRLIRSKGVGVYFITQTPKDVPSEIPGQLGNRVQHARRAFTPEDAKAPKATVSTFLGSKEGKQIQKEVVRGVFGMRKKRL
jgi:hypothetical protein